MLRVKTRSFAFLVKKLHSHINHTHTNKFTCRSLIFRNVHVSKFHKYKFSCLSTENNFCSKVWHGCGIIQNSSKTNNIFTRLIYTHDLIAHTCDHSPDLNKPTHLINKSSSLLSPQPAGTVPWGSRPRANAEHALSCGLTSKCWCCSCTWNMWTSHVQIKYNTTE